ncbi:NTP transferase domain-containing protein [Sphingosinicella rhizophila]|uniref:NTP transferase domain-containing protein n=1 Tax=Sphingosinicella rhizophila TaxID=3050082 RepID=A0ABU3Q3F0_9SPHN|nr:NTP transferase domain-containing protein [Sphingosinicella sp. GR2756]MDT9597937.1 NTP transferase domain-containing protein [Sphingosinicella sp. GR2756]
MPHTFTAVILAAQRGGRIDPLAAEAGVTHKCLVPILGRPLIEYVLDALIAVPGLERIRVCIEPGAVEAVKRVAGASGERGIPVDYVPSAETITESAYASAEGVEGPIVLTTADNVNLTPGAVLQMLQEIEHGADAVVALASKSSVLASHPEAQRRFYEFSDDAYSNCNLYALAGRQALAMAETFREGGQFAKSPKRMIRAFGLINILLLRFRLISLSGAMKRLSRRFGGRVRAAVLADGRHAVDVDNERTYRIAKLILERKAAGPGVAA